MEDLAVYLREQRLPELFVDGLGWDVASGVRAWSVEGCLLPFRTIAGKHGVQVIWCPDGGAALVNPALLQKFQNLAARVIRDHILVFSSEELRQQVWSWCVQKQARLKLPHRQPLFFSDRPQTALLNWLEPLRFDRDREEDEPVVDSMNRLRSLLDAAFEAERCVPKGRRPSISTALAKALQHGDANACRRFVRFHRGLARKLSKRFQRWFDMPAEDAVQAATLALIEAALRFKPERGLRFATFARAWFKQVYRRRAAPATLLLHVPALEYQNCLRHEIDLETRRSDGGPSAVRDRLAELEALDPEQAERGRDFLRARKVASLSDRDLLRAAQALPDLSTPPPFGNLLRADTVQEVRAALDRLNPKLADLLRLRFGLDGDARTLQWIGARMNLSRERVRQLEELALAKLRPKLLKNL